MGSCLNGVAQVFAAATSPLIAYFSFRTIFNGGLLILTFAMIILAVFAMVGWNTLLVVMMMVFLACFQWTLGTYTWVYLGAVACEEGLSIGTGFIWGGVVLISLITPPMMDALETSGTFFFFAASCFASFIFFFFMLRETKGLTREEA